MRTLGVHVGLPADGSWIEQAIDEEAELITRLRPGPPHRQGHCRMARGHPRPDAPLRRAAARAPATRPAPAGFRPACAENAQAARAAAREAREQLRSAGRRRARRRSRRAAQHPRPDLPPRRPRPARHGGSRHAPSPAARGAAAFSTGSPAEASVASCDAKVSVVVPVWNPGPNIQRCFDGLFAQTMPDTDYETRLRRRRLDRRHRRPARRGAHSARTARTSRSSTSRTPAGREGHATSAWTPRAVSTSTSSTTTTRSHRRARGAVQHGRPSATPTSSSASRRAIFAT